MRKVKRVDAHKIVTTQGKVGRTLGGAKITTM